MTMVGVAVVSGAAGMFLSLLCKTWIPAAALGGLFVMLTAGATVLIRRADPEELRRQQDEADRNLDALVRAFASASGAWGTRSHRKRSTGE
jgi:hypothetical protein